MGMESPIASSPVEYNIPTAKSFPRAPIARCTQCNIRQTENARNLVVCIDGTRNEFGPISTNVVKLFQKVDRKTTPEQHACYFSGIGTGSKSSHLLDRVGRAVFDTVDMAIAWNFGETVKKAYGWLAKMYQEGDQIYLFGFSRGAYQVRVLAAMIYEVGLIRNPTDKSIGAAYDLFAARKPNSKQITKEFRRAFSRDGVRVHFVGVWDTVSSVGFVRGDVSLSTSSTSSHACHFRHALALDELRVKFIPEYLQEINSHTEDGESKYIVTSPDKHATSPLHERRGFRMNNFEANLPVRNMHKAADIKEVWFPGSHSDVGGTDRPGKAYHAGNVSLLWMRREAAASGLVLQPTDIVWVPDDVDLGISDSMSNASFQRPQPRRIIPGQKIHASILYASVYKPQASLGEGFHIPFVHDELDAELDDGLWDTGLFEDSAAEELIAHLGNSKEVEPTYLDALLFMLRTKEGRQCVRNVPHWQDRFTSLIHDPDIAPLTRLVIIVAYYEAFCDPDAHQKSPASPHVEPPQGMFDDAKKSLTAVLAEHKIQDCPRVVAVLRPLTKHQVLRERLLTRDVLETLMVLLDRIIDGGGSIFGQAMDGLDCLLQCEDTREIIIEKLGATMLSRILEINDARLLTVALRVVMTLARIPEWRAMCLPVKPRLRELARMKEQLVGLPATEILLALYDPRDTEQLSLRDAQVRADVAGKKIVTLEQTVRGLHKQLSASHHMADQKEESYKESIHVLQTKLLERDETSGNRIAQLEKAVEQLRTELVNSQRKADNLLQIIHVKLECEALYAEGRIMDAASSLLQILEPLISEVKGNNLIMDWLTEFTKSCITMLEKVGDEASDAGKTDDSVAAYAIALLLTPSMPDAILVKWTSAMLIRGPPCEVLGAAAKFKLPKFLIHRTICDILEEAGRNTEAIEYFRQMYGQLSQDADPCNGQVQWELDFRNRCAEKLEKLGDNAIEFANHDQAIGFYSDALSLDPTNLLDILVKRSKGLVISSAWEEALIDADRVIDLDPSSFRGYERKHATLHAMGHYGEAFEAFVAMLSRLEESPDPLIRELRHKYVDATPAIRRAIAQAIQPMPRVLINTTTGRLYDKMDQAAAFEALPVYDELRSSMTTVLDYEHIQETVDTFYRYVMLSHRWQPCEPTFQTVQNISVYGLPASPANSKLHSFCDLVRSLQFHWAWSDTCCVDQLDKGVVQESLVAMFKWYRGSSLTIVHLLGVLSGSQVPYLWKSIWNTRGWTYQEYVASETVRFYTEDWKPYLGLDMFNHKESHLILSEMEKATDYASQGLATLFPGLDKVREKLYLASGRHTTREEDIAYCLFGIFNVAIPVIYGEGDRAVGRLLEHVLTGSGEVMILAWTGRVGSYNSCLPVDLTVYNQIVPPHVPQPFGTVEMDNKVMALRSTAVDLSLLVSLYQRLHELPSPSVASSRLRLPGIVFPITTLDDISEPDSQTAPHVYRAATFALGVVEIKTRDDLSGMKNLVLIHPWIGPLLDQEFARGTSGLDETTRALQLAVRLKQPFGALLLEPLSRLQYRRVATDSLIMVRVIEEVSLTELTEGIRVVDVQ